MASIISSLGSLVTAAENGITALTALSKLRPASFRGVSFLVDTSTTDGGRKVVTHEYPQSSKRFVEDLGELQETYTLNGFVHGDDYAQKRDNLIAALKNPGRGQLIHPMFGVITVVAKPYNLNETMVEFGIARFTMTFERCDIPTNPVVSSDNTSLISSITDDLLGSISDDLSSVFLVSNKFPNNFISAQGIIRGVGAALGINVNNFLKITTQISQFNSNLASFIKNINRNIKDPSNLAFDFTNLFGTYALLGATPANQYSMVSSLFGYGSTVAPISTSTLQGVERARNAQIIYSAMNISAIANAYNIVTDLTFTTDRDIQLVQNQLQVQFEYIMNNNNASDDTIQLLKNLQVQVIKYLEQQLVNAFKIATIYTQEIPLSILCFDYYGNVDNTNNLIALNNSIDCTFVQGDINILTA